MKYIRLYESFNKTEIEQTLREICLELEDDGYEINIFNFRNGLSILRIYKGKRIDNFRHIREYLLRMKDYLGDNYIRFEYLNDGKFKEIELCDVTDMWWGLEMAEIVYKNE